MLRTVFRASLGIFSTLAILLGGVSTSFQLAYRYDLGFLAFLVLLITLCLTGLSTLWTIHHA